MTVYGFHASHEQVPPADLLQAVVRAEQAGFTAAMCSDHFSPWSIRQNESGFAWSWLGAALQATELTFGVVNAPGQRYHPAIIAQAISTLASMYPGRFWAALGTGEASNEHITGEGWPRKEQRTERLEQAVDVMRRLLRGDEVSHDGLVTVDRARLWTLPTEVPALLGAAVSERTAKWCAGWADGLITVNAEPDTLRRLIAAYKDAGGRGKVCLQVHLSYAATDEEALAIAHDQWRSNVFPPPFCWDTDTAEAFDLAAEHVPPEAMHKTVHVSSDPGRHADWLNEYAELGFDAIYLHHVGQEQSEFVDTFGAKVLPQLEVTRP
ncbi:TIGR03885 family FMN-dependent LLM class oxidoreductase [Kribbella lupini]|uniref:TIGR03885 family FMN-dependent LLM class oxidoreductase n=1 Tax=Kribbella lupini TaxID=291602 RepID=A0ABN2B7A3_9ACTN